MLFGPDDVWESSEDIKSVMSFFRSSKTFTGMLFGLDDLWESSEDITKNISFLSVGVKKNVFVFVIERWSVQCLGKNLIFDFVFSAIEMK